MDIPMQKRNSRKRPKKETDIVDGNQLRNKRHENHPRIRIRLRRPRGCQSRRAGSAGPVEAALQAEKRRVHSDAVGEGVDQWRPRASQHSGLAKP